MTKESSDKLENTIEKRLTKRHWEIILWIVIAIVVAFSLLMGIKTYTTPESRLSRQLDLGQRYLKEQNYEQAVVEFDKAIKIDPMSVEAYLGMADAYKGLEDYAMARQILEQGYELTGDERLLAALQAMDVSDEAGVEINENEEVEESLEDNHYVELNYDFSECSILGYKAGNGSDFDIHEVWKSYYSDNFIYTDMYDGSNFHEETFIRGDECIELATVIHASSQDAYSTYWIDYHWPDVTTLSFTIMKYFSSSGNWRLQFDYCEPDLNSIYNDWVVLPADMHLGDSYDRISELLQLEDIKDKMQYEDTVEIESRIIKSFSINTQYGEVKFNDWEYVESGYDFAFNINMLEYQTSITCFFIDDNLVRIILGLDM